MSVSDIGSVLQTLPFKQNDVLVSQHNTLRKPTEKVSYKHITL